MEPNKMTAFDIAIMAQMLLSLIKGKGMDESIANSVLQSIGVEYGLTPPILW